MATGNDTTTNYDTEFTLPSDREVRCVRAFDAPRRLVWEAHVKPEHVSQWALGPEGWTMPLCEMDVRPGGTWHWRWRKADGAEEFGMTGEFREVIPEARLVNTENWGDEWPETLNTAEFSEENGRTTVTTTVLYASKEARDAAIRTGMEDGWAYTYTRLDDYLTRMG